MGMVIKKATNATATGAGPKVVKKATPKVDMQPEDSLGQEVVHVPDEPVQSSAPKTLKATPAAKAEFKAMKAQVTKQNPDGSEEATEEMIGGEMFDEPPANVAVNLGLTRNLGNYESIKFSVSLSVPTANKPEEIEQAFAFAKEWVDAKVNQINSEVDEMVK